MIQYASKSGFGNKKNITVNGKKIYTKFSVKKKVRVK